jgi:hypothetical protein
MERASGVERAARKSERQGVEAGHSHDVVTAARYGESIRGIVQTAVES